MSQLSESSESGGDDFERLTARSQKHLLDECEAKWLELQKLQRAITEVKVPTAAVGDNALSTVLHTKELHLRAHKALLRDSKPDPPVTRPTIQLELLNSDLADSVTQITDTLSLVKTQKKEIEAEIKRETKVNGMLKELQSALTSKLDEATRNSLTERILLQRLDDRDKKATAESIALSNTTQRFVKDNFPIPEADQLKEWGKKNRSRRRSMRLLSLSDIVEELINLCLERPHDPYMELEYLHWPPYVELLLRNGIALKHPNDDHRIKLVPFHL